MAAIFKPQYTKTDPATGKKQKRRLKKWYIKYRDGNGVVKRVPGYTDKRSTQHLAIELERRTERQDALPPKIDPNGWTQTLDSLPDDKVPERCVYFIQAATGHIKIGFSEQLQARLRALQLASPVALRLLATLGAKGPESEAKIHARFSGLRSHGEWFFPAQQLVEFIQSISSRQGNNNGPHL